ncbi:hypothetical protein [Streptomyces sp. NPDC059788]|uniref:hypothetical protein n=1 Tax=Streptomyces sp. NPDC059788 TaxID=3346948 RepID=UPI00364C6765
MKDMNANSEVRAGRFAGPGQMPPAALAESLRAQPLTAAEHVMISEESHDLATPDARLRYLCRVLLADGGRTRARIAELESACARYRTAWQLARTRALSTGGAADRYAARARGLQEALQGLLIDAISAKSERDSARRRVIELSLRLQRVRETLAAASPLRAGSLPPQREAKIRASVPNDWFGPPWTAEYVEGDGKNRAHYQVKARNGGVVATLPDWLQDLALFVADAPEAISELLAELDRVRTVACTGVGAPIPARPALLPEPYACARCDMARRPHDRRYTEVGGHTWVRPTDEQIKARMKARQDARQRGADRG